MAVHRLLAASISPIEHVADRPWLATPRLWGGHVLSMQIVTMMLAAAVLLAVLLAAAASRAIRPRGRAYNMLEAFVLFVRDMIARPALGPQAYRFLPFLLTMFLFILTCNLIGLVPLLELSQMAPALANYPIGGAPTGNVWMTGALAGVVLLTVLGAGVGVQASHAAQWHGGRVVGWAAAVPLFLWSLVPPMPRAVKIAMAPLLIVLELIGLLAKCFALAIRLFANMSAGHLLLAVLAMFVALARQGGLGGWLVAPGSAAGMVAMGLLELMVAFIQAFIFTFLSALFIGAAVCPHP